MQRYNINNRLAYLSGGVQSAGGMWPDNNAYLNALLATSPIGLWSLQDTSGSTAVDSSGNGRNGAYHGTYTLAARTGPEKLTTNAYPDFGVGGVNVYSAGLAGAFNGDEGTVAGWFRWDHQGATDHAWYFAADANNYVRLSRSNVDRLTFYYRAASTSRSVASVYSYSDDWYHAAITWSQTNDETVFYLNGIRIYSATMPGTWSGSLASSWANFAAQTTTGSRIDGSAAWCGVWATPLSAATIADTLYSGATAPNDETFTGPSLWSGVEAMAPALDGTAYLNQVSADNYQIYWKVKSGSPTWWARYGVDRQSGSGLFANYAAAISPTVDSATPDSWTPNTTYTIQDQPISSNEYAVLIGGTLAGANHGNETLTSESWTVDGSAASFSGGWDSGSVIVYTCESDITISATTYATVTRTMTLDVADGYIRHDITWTFATTSEIDYVLTAMWNHTSTNVSDVVYDDNLTTYSITQASETPFKFQDATVVYNPLYPFGGISRIGWTSPAGAARYRISTRRAFIGTNDKTYMEPLVKVKLVSGDVLSWTIDYKIWGGYDLEVDY